MVYQGSKNRISKFLVPIIQKYIDDNNIKTYIEPMVGGANIIDKIVCENKVGGDINSELIALLQYIQTDNEISIAPEMCTFEHYTDVRENRRLHTNKYSMKYTALMDIVLVMVVDILMVAMVEIQRVEEVFITKE